MIRESYEQAQHANYPRGTCRDCHVPCDPHTREYRSMELCSQCYDDVPPLKTITREKQHGTVPKPGH